MSDLFDIQPAVDAVLSAEDLIKAQGLPPDKSRFETGDSNGLFEGSVPGGITLAGKGSLLVQGSLEGSVGSLCHIDIAGDVVITGDVRYAQINCRQLRVGGALLHSLVSTGGDVFIGADLVRTRLLIGDYQARKRRIEELRHEISRRQEDRTTLDRRISQDEKRLDRSCKATRVPLNFSLSRIIIQEHNRIRINLTSLYSSLGDQPEPKLKLALNEFFAKGIIGYLAKSNRKYIADNPAREKVFLQLLKHLRELFMEIFERDQLIAMLNRSQAEIDQWVEGLRQQNFSLHVRGAILPETEVEFPRPRVQRLENSEINFIHQAATLKVQPGSQSSVLRLERVDTEGESSADDVKNADLQGISLRLEEGQVVWIQVA